jgi:hypothetical protein
LKLHGKTLVKLSDLEVKATTIIQMDKKLIFYRVDELDGRRKLKKIRNEEDKV